ncbi:hypothetical protein ERO13_D12G136650v2 [Gossypium hirsutum]|nr:hypothetical protein ERO13_D12G136650v2 [Gossypium hirsutum]
MSLLDSSSNLYALLTENSPENSPFHTNRSACSTIAKGIHRILSMFISEKASKHPPQH